MTEFQQPKFGTMFNGQPLVLEGDFTMRALETTLGGPIEVTALGLVFQRQFLASVGPNDQDPPDDEEEDEEYEEEEDEDDEYADDEEEEGDYVPFHGRF